MRLDGKSNKRRAKSLTISKLSSVAAPAHEGAIAAIIKSKGVVDITKQMFVDVLEEMEVADAVRSELHDMWRMGEALHDSISSIVRDTDIVDKKSKIKESINQYIGAMNTKLDNSQTIKEKDKKKAKPKQSENSDETKMEQEADEMAKKEENVDVTAELAKMKKELETATKMVEMSDVVKSYYKGLPEDDKTEFIKMTVSEMEVEIEKAKDTGDETMTANGVTISKSAVGAEAFAFLKAQAEENAKDKAELVKERENRLLKEAAEKAETDFANLPGDSTEKGKAMMFINAMPETERETIKAMLKAGDTAVSDLFEEKGTVLGDSTIKTAGDKVSKMVDDYQTQHGVTKTEAWKAVMNRPEVINACKGVH